MSPSPALAIATPGIAPSVTASAPLRDFTQPWMDLNNRTVLVTGGTGSFGKHFIKTVIAQYAPKRLIIFSRDELKQFEMQQEFPDSRYACMRSKSTPSSAISSATSAIATVWSWP